MSNTSNLVLPYLAAGQAQKHVTVNETLRKLDALVQLSVVSATTMAEPVSPADGAVYIVPAGKSGTHWSAFANWSLGYYRDGAWVEIAPREGWIAFARDSDQILHYTGSAWSLFPVGKAITVSATDKLLGRATAGAGAAEEIACTAAGRALLDDADAAAQRATLGLGTAATQNTGTSGANVPLMSGANSWASKQTLAAGGEAMRLATTGSVGAGATAFFTIHDGGGQQGYFGFAGLNSGFDIWSGPGCFQRYLVDGGAAGFRIEAAGHLRPEADNAQKLGAASQRWSTVYAATGSINTSDAREKTGLRPPSDAERRAIRRVMAGVGVFQWLSAIEAKGQNARLHIGVTAQAVADAFAAEGLDGERYGLFCADYLAADETGERQTRLGVRYDQVFAMALAALFTADA